MAEPSETKPQKKLSKIHDPENKLAYWGFRIILAGVTICIPAYFGYKSSLNEANVAKVKAEAGYAEMAKHIEEMQSAMKDMQTTNDQQNDQQNLAIAEMRGYLKALSDMGKFSEPKPAKPAPIQDTKGGGASEPAKPDKMATFENAIMQQMELMKSRPKAPKEFRPVQRLDKAVFDYKQQIEAK